MGAVSPPYVIAYPVVNLATVTRDDKARYFVQILTNQPLFCSSLYTMYFTI